ncbi:TenA family transcriptional regulator [bacterium M00.F.Ca.ET.228.01.1.1]|nr:TenA family transcriptional regulator [bacterium M00.F.Ca.ET.228.01.1.1]TGR95241.1 TenA family transcriptional regulator [bacterium M00.F.Ca.ET.191.01.1.1]TGT96071.1 TenA family transcriptional regulator [bacterium M00.F.Ca.ET.155.01.1.1]
MKEIASYPAWLGEVLDDTADLKQRIVNHPVIAAMSEARLEEQQAQAFLINGWPVVEQFPQYMAMNLQKLRYGGSRGHELARRYLTRNIRVEQRHAEYWTDWAAAHGVSERALMMQSRPSAAYSLSHWCWKSSNADPLAVSIAATNYAIEGVTGEWTSLVCGAGKYTASFPESVRQKATYWLRLHAHYDDEHPWEALEIVATLLGRDPQRSEIEAVRQAIQMSFEYYKVSLDCCL